MNNKFFLELISEFYNKSNNNDKIKLKDFFGYNKSKITTSFSNIIIRGTYDDEEIASAKRNGLILDNENLKVFDKGNGNLNLILDLRKPNLEIDLQTVNGKVTVINFAGSKLNINTSNGKVEIINCVTSDLSITSINGKIKAENIVSKYLDTHTRNGDISIRNVLCDNGKIHSINGIVSVSDCAASETLALDTDNENIICNNTAAKKYLAQSKSGDVKLVRTTFDESSITSNSGHVYLSIVNGNIVDVHSKDKEPTVEYIKK